MTRHVGIEEELLLVDPVSGCPQALATVALETVGDDADAAVDEELQQEQIETATRPCLTLDEAAAEVRRGRKQAAAAAQAAGAALAALATSPLEVAPTTTAKARYRRMRREFGLTASEQLSCGCHIHVEVASDEEAVAALDRIRVWLPVLLALSANSPFYQGRDSGYESFRSQVWNRWPSAGPTGLFRTPERYHETVEALIATGTVLDAGMVYFDARLARHYPTLEIRVADVCLDPDDTVLLAALSRALVETAVWGAKAGEPPPEVPTALVRVATWRAGRSGLANDLVDPRTLNPAPAPAVVDALLDHVRPALEEAGDWDTVTDLVAQLQERGTGAARQREMFARTGDLAHVVRMAAAATLPAGATAG